MLTCHGDSNYQKVFLVVFAHHSGRALALKFAPVVEEPDVAEERVSMVTVDGSDSAALT